ncbi:MAG: hypothetical protein M1834_005085 [Cirrosporium novae-zelandiae]|nr:MAG: hypothetical protein M1834_005085 [Cirrosporium novae-zelandiae]
MAPYPNGINILLGTSAFGPASNSVAMFNTPKQVQEVLNIFGNRGYTGLDTTRGYPGGSEALLGEVDASKTFVIDTKVVSFAPKTHTKEKIEKSIKDSLEALKVKKVNTMYLHSPDQATPFKETLEAINAAYQAEIFVQWGVSNFSAIEVEQIIKICDDNGWVKPKLYQGQYNAAARRIESELLPLLRKHGMSFIAWSPAAGGFFAQEYDPSSVGSHFDVKTATGVAFTKIYQKPELLEAQKRSRELSKEMGQNGHLIALRRTAHHSKLLAEEGDGLVVGFSSTRQLKDNLHAIEVGPLSEVVVDAIEDCWEHSKEAAPSYYID